VLSHFRLGPRTWWVALLLLMVVGRPVAAMVVGSSKRKVAPVS
jgi:hypothetical protein